MSEVIKWRSPFGRLGAEQISDSKFNEMVGMFDEMFSKSIVINHGVERHAQPPWPLEVHFSENGPELRYEEYVIEIIETGQEIVLTVDGMRSLASLLNEAVEAADAEGSV